MALRKAACDPDETNWSSGSRAVCNYVVKAGIHFPAENVLTCLLCVLLVCCPVEASSSALPLTISAFLKLWKRNKKAVVHSVHIQRQL